MHQERSVSAVTGIRLPKYDMYLLLYYSRPCFRHMLIYVYTGQVRRAYRRLPSQSRLWRQIFGIIHLFVFWYAGSEILICSHAYGVLSPDDSVRYNDCCSELTVCQAAYESYS